MNSLPSAKEYADMPVEQFMKRLKNAGKIDFSDKVCSTCKRTVAINQGRLLRLGVASQIWQCDDCFNKQNKKINQIKRKK